VLAFPAPDGEGKMEEGMSNQTIQTVLLIAAGALLILYLVRRRKRKGLDK
jgi:LPXTG-motif cell wall-anchored protein